MNNLICTECTDKKEGVRYTWQVTYITYRNPNGRQDRNQKRDKTDLEIKVIKIPEEGVYIFLSNNQAGGGQFYGN